MIDLQQSTATLPLQQQKQLTTNARVKKSSLKTNENGARRPESGAQWGGLLGELPLRVIHMSSKWAMAHGRDSHYCSSQITR